MAARTVVCAVLIAAVAEGAERPWPPSAEAVPIMLRVERLFWRSALPGLPESTKFAALEGNPNQPGSFTIRVTLPAGTVVPSHSHPWSTRMTVLSGKLAMGLDEWELAAGGFWACPAGFQQSFVAREDAVVQISGTGAWAMTYLNPRDDPRGASGAPSK